MSTDNNHNKPTIDKRRMQQLSTLYGPKRTKTRDRLLSVLDFDFHEWEQINFLFSLAIPEWTLFQRHDMIRHLIHFLELKIAIEEYIPWHLLAPSPLIDKAWRALVLETELYSKVCKVLHDFHFKKPKKLHYSIINTITKQPMEKKESTTDTDTTGAVYNPKYSSSSSANNDGTPTESYESKLRRTQSLFLVYFQKEMPMELIHDRTATISSPKRNYARPTEFKKVTPPNKAYPNMNDAPPSAAMMPNRNTTTTKSVTNTSCSLGQRSFFDQPAQDSSMLHPSRKQKKTTSNDQYKVSRRSTPSNKEVTCKHQAVQSFACLNKRASSFIDDDMQQNSIAEDNAEPPLNRSLFVSPRNKGIKDSSHLAPTSFSNQQVPARRNNVNGNTKGGLFIVKACTPFGFGQNAAATCKQSSATTKKQPKKHSKVENRITPPEFITVDNQLPLIKNRSSETETTAATSTTRGTEVISITTHDRNKITVESTVSPPSPTSFTAGPPESPDLLQTRRYLPGRGKKQLQPKNNEDLSHVDACRTPDKVGGPPLSNPSSNRKPPTDKHLFSPSSGLENGHRYKPRQQKHHHHHHHQQQQQHQQQWTSPNSSYISPATSTTSGSYLDHDIDIAAFSRSLSLSSSPPSEAIVHNAVSFEDPIPPKDDSPAVNGTTETKPSYSIAKPYPFKKAPSMFLRSRTLWSGTQ